jgi:hypothetical protein
MCNKTRVFKNVYALMMTVPPNLAPKAIQVFKTAPSKELVDSVMTNYFTKNKVEPNSYIYSEKPQAHVVEIQIPSDMLLH